MGRRTLLLIVALIIAALGTVLVFFYAQNAQNAAQEGQTLVKVLVAKTQIEVGTTGAAASASGAFAEQSVPKTDVVAGALADATPLASLVALTTVFPGQQIIAQQWGAAVTTSGLGLPAGTIAMSVQLGDPERVAGFVQPGASVAIMTWGEIKPASGTTPAVMGVRTLLTGIQVIAVGPTTVISKTSGNGTSANTEQIPTAILTLAVTQQQAEKIVYISGKVSGSTFSGMWFGLTDKNSKVTANDAGITGDNLFK